MNEKLELATISVRGYALFIDLALSLLLALLLAQLAHRFFSESVATPMDARFEWQFQEDKALTIDNVTKITRHMLYKSLDGKGRVIEECEISGYISEEQKVNTSLRPTEILWRDCRVGVIQAEGYLFVIIFLLQNFIFDLISTKSSLGKRVFQLRVLDYSNGKPSFVSLLLRNVTRLVSVCVLCLGLIPALFDGRRRTLHDRFAGTCVYRSPDLTRRPSD